MPTIKIKPLSVNKAWRGRRFKTPEYNKYQRELLALLPDIELPPSPYTLRLRFGFSSKSSDIDNPVKLKIDILQKRYGFNDKLIYRLIVDREHVKKGNEYIHFEIESYE